MIAFGYVGGDTGDKTVKSLQRGDSAIKVAENAIDTLLWQTLASVAIPGYVIRLITFTSESVVTNKKFETKLPKKVIRFGPTGIGLFAIPFIIKPIDHSVDYLFENYLRKWFKTK